MGLWQLGGWLETFVGVVGVAVTARLHGVAIWPGFYRLMGEIPHLVVFHISKLVLEIMVGGKKLTSLVDVLQGI